MRRMEESLPGEGRRRLANLVTKRAEQLDRIENGPLYLWVDRVCVKRL